LVVHIVTMRL